MPYTMTMKRLLTTLAPTFISLVVFITGAYALSLLHAYQAQRAEAASTQQIGAFPYFLAGSGITSSATTITLTSLTMPQTGALITTSMLSATFYLTLEPGSTSRQEFASCTTVTQNSNGTATLTGCTRGLLPFTPYTASTTYAFSHSGGTTAIFSNPPQVYSLYPAKANDETITGQWTFNTFPVTPASPVGSETVSGILQLATALQAASSTSSGSIGRLALAAIVATDTPVYGCAVGYTGTAGAGCTVVARLNGKISSSFIDQTTSYAWTNTHTFTGNVNLNGTTTLSTSAVGVSANVPLVLVSTSTSAVVNSNNATTTLWSYTLPANTLGKNDMLRIHVSMTDQGCGGTSNMGLFYGTGSATTTLTAISAIGSQNVYVDTNLFNIGATNSQDSDDVVRIATAAQVVSNKTAAVDTTAKSFLSVRYFCSNGSNANVRNITVEKLGSQ